MHAKLGNCGNGHWQKLRKRSHLESPHKKQRALTRACLPIESQKSDGTPCKDKRRLSVFHRVAVNVIMAHEVGAYACAGKEREDNSNVSGGFLPNADESHCMRHELLSLRLVAYQ